MKRTVSTQTLVRLALLAAIELVLAYTPLGYLRLTAGLEISFLMIPVTLGAILLGPTCGAILGGIFGLTSFGTCFGTSPFGMMLLGMNPILTFIVCVPTRILAGWLTGLIFKALYNLESRRAQASGAEESGRVHWFSFGCASLAGPVLNTVFFMVRWSSVFIRRNTSSRLFRCSRRQSLHVYSFVRRRTRSDRSASRVCRERRYLQSRISRLYGALTSCRPALPRDGFFLVQGNFPQKVFSNFRICDKLLVAVITGCKKITHVRP